MAEEERKGKIIYEEKSIQVRTFPRDLDSYSIYIGNQHFLFDSEGLGQITQRTPIRDLETTLDAYNLSIRLALEREVVSPEAFTLILARAKMADTDYKLTDLLCLIS